LEEENTLNAIIKQVWIKRDDGLMSAVLALANHVTSVPSGISAEWLQQASSLFHDILQRSTDQAFLSWANGVQVRTLLLREALPAAAKRKQLGEGMEIQNRAHRLESSIESLRKQNEELSKAIKSHEDRLKNEESAASEAEHRLAAILSAESSDIECVLRRHFVRNKSNWKNLMIDPHIAGRKVANARTACGVPTSERVIAVFDLTVFGSAKDAVVFGSSAIYFRTKTAPVQLSYKKLLQYTVGAQKSELTFSPKFNGDTAFAASGTLSGTDVLAVLQSVQILFA
jgi:hypothetical protein